MQVNAGRTTRYWEGAPDLLLLPSPMLHGYVAEGAYRVSDTFPIQIRVGHAPDTYLCSIQFFINFVIFDYASGYVSLSWIRSSPTKIMSPRRPRHRRSHLLRLRRLQRTRTWTPHPCSSVIGDEPPPPLAGRRRRASAPARWRQASVPAHGLLHTCAPPPAYMCAASCAGDAPLLAGHHRRACPSVPSSSSRPPRRRTREQSPVSHGRSQLP